MEHYYSNHTHTELKPRQIPYTLGGRHFLFTTGNAVFSKSKVDFGSDLLLRTFLQKEPAAKGRLLDLGCGYGVVGVSLAALCPELFVCMVDVNERAVLLARQNALAQQVEARAKAKTSDGFLALSDLSFDFILTNPPIRTGKTNVQRFYQGSFEHLAAGGSLYVVIQKKQGAPSSKKFLEERFGNCEILAKEAGYYILHCQKR